MSERLNNYNNYQTDSTNDELENSQIDYLNDETEKASQDLIGHFHQEERPESTPQYEYQEVDVEEVIKIPKNILFRNA